MLSRSAAYKRHDPSKLLAAHNSNAVIGPRKNKARIVSTARHPIVTSTITGSNHQRNMWDSRIRDGVNQLGPILNNPLLLIARADHKARNVLHKEKRDIPKIAQLDKLCPLLCFLSKQNPIVPQHAHRKTMNGTPTSHQRRPIQRL